MPGPDDVEMLYHYTNIGGVRGILESGTLRATFARLMNDRDEVLEGFKIVEDVVNAHGSERAQNALHRSIKADSHQDGVFVACLTTEPDHLGLWRAYGADGYALGIDIEALRGCGEYTPHQTVSLLKVRYGEGEFREWLVNVIEKSDTDEQLVPLEMWVLAAAYKSEQWRDEHEWRLVTFHHTFCENEAAKLETEIRGPWPKPYIELPLVPELPDTRAAASGGTQPRDVNNGTFKDVCIGPSSYAEERRLAMHYMLLAMGFQKDVDVRKTTIGLRG